MDEAETVEAVFTQAKDAEASAEEYPVDVGWEPALIDKVVSGASRIYLTTGC